MQILQLDKKSEMIPKIIHYCWFGHNPLPPLAIKCIESWKKFLPDYEIKEWNEDNFDVNIIPYSKEAYKAKKYAFVSDYARFWILYKYGGLYFDTDVEVIKPLDDIVAKGPFMGCENEVKDDRAMALAIAPGLGVNPGLGLGVNPGHGLYKKILGLYVSLRFVDENGNQNLKTVVDYTTELLCKHGLENKSGIQYVAGIYVYPVDYFCPISVDDGKLRITSNTRTIHHYAQSWQSPARKYGRKFVLMIGGHRLKCLIKRMLKPWLN